MNKEIMKCPECGKHSLYLKIDAWIVRPIKQHYRTYKEDEFQQTFDHFIVECGECGETDESSTKLADIARYM